ncbi:MAG TPA: cell wall hydrolase [Caulobacteraceae bacterium]|nr:cell wall hydrolase [Caulobacteraceae bacterium]
MVAAAAPAAVQQIAVQAATPTALKAGLRSAIEMTPARPFKLAAGVQGSSRDVDCLTAAVYYEARGESVAGQAAVAQVVLNRVRHPAFPKTVCGVVYQGVHTGAGCQFSFACDGAVDRPHEIAAWRRAQGVAIHALAGGVMAAVGDATHFHSLSAGSGVGRGMTRVAQIGLQVFYKFSGYEGAPSRFSAAPQRSSADDASPAQADGRASGRYLLASAPAQSAAPSAPAPAKDPAPSEAAKGASPSL